LLAARRGQQQFANAGQPIADHHDQRQDIYVDGAAVGDQTLRSFIGGRFEAKMLGGGR